MSDSQSQTDDNSEASKEDKGELRKIDTYLRLYFNIDPDALSDDDWAMRWNELKWALAEGHPFVTPKGRL